MRFAKFAVCSLAAVLLLASPAQAQPYMEQVEESTQEMQESMEAWAEFIKDVTFDEQDVKDVISYWSEINALDVSDEEEVVGMDEEEEEMIDFEELLAFPEYRAWAKSKSLDPDVWLKKFMRIQAMIMKDAMGDGMAEGQAQVQEQIQALEAQRAQLGEEMYQQMKAAMEAGAAAIAGAQSAYADLPDPTAPEKDILDRYRDQLMNLE